MKKMMVLGAGVFQIPAILKAKELGYFVIAVDRDANAAGIPYADTFLQISTIDQEEIYRKALLLRPDVIITCTSDAPVRTVAYVNEMLGRSGDLTYTDALCATNKAHMRRRLQAYGVPIPAFYVTESLDDFRAAVAALHGLCIVKPADNAGSRGVVLLNQHLCDSIDKIYEYSKNFSRSGTVMVEEYLEGKEVSVEAFTVEGVTNIIAITDKLTTAPPFFVEIGHSEPSMQSPEVLEEIRYITRQAVAAIHLKNGPSHTEVKITKEGPKIVELAARLGGDFITSKLVPLSTGVDMVGSSILQAVQQPIDLAAKWSRGSAIRFLAAHSGTIGCIRGVENAKALPGVVEVVLYKQEGDQICNLESSNDRIGHVITCADTAQAAIEQCEQALSQIEILVD